MKEERHCCHIADTVSRDRLSMCFFFSSFKYLHVKLKQRPTGIIAMSDERRKQLQKQNISGGKPVTSFPKHLSKESYYGSFLI